jgi:5-dehydro-2-deoxygluconokinase
VDLYPLQTGVGLEDVTSFGKWLGGSAATWPWPRLVRPRTRGHHPDRGRPVRPVPAPGAARLPGRRPVRHRGAGAAHPVTFCEIFPPDDFPLYFYRKPTAPDLQIRASELDLAAIEAAGVFWVTGTGLSEEPSRTATLEALAARARRGITVLDLDYRPMFWASREAAREQIQRALPLVTVAVGNLDECDTAVGEREPLPAAAALHAFGVELAVVKQGPKGVLAHDGTVAVEVPPMPVEVVNGLGAGDAFGGALCHGLLAGWPAERIMRFANAAGAIVAGRVACSDAMPTAAEVEAALEGRRA